MLITKFSSRSSYQLWNMIIPESLLPFHVWKVQWAPGKERYQWAHQCRLKHTILYIHCVDLLMWSPTKLDFPFYDFSVIYYDVSKI
jgi:hypothetical protein